jgi:2-phospho-L-lactate guanylyltransferase
VQATVFRYDPETATGSVMTDQGLVMPFDEHAMAASGLRHLRPGQRLTVELDEEAEAIVALRLGTIVPG